MSATPLDTNCVCGGAQKIEACTAAHAENMVDIVITCDSCDRVLNAFLNMDDFIEIRTSA